MSKLVVLPPPVVPVPADQVIVVDELVTEGYRDVPLHLVRISYTNRTRFDPEALQQLADSIAEVGILQPILMRPVTPTADAPQILEIVAGERRFRAAVMAGLIVAPASIKVLTDKQAAEIQLLENIQRENPHPLEEAIGFEQLMLNHGFNADQLAAKVKQSRSYVYGRLKLCALSIKARELFLDDIKRFPASTALLIARIPTPELQDKALGEIMQPQYNGELMSVRQAATHISSRYTLNLDSAPFDPKDAKLMAAAGNCVKCPKRTGNQPEIYSDAMSADVCTDPDCFAEKKAAHYQRIIVHANKRGIPVLEGDDAREVHSNAWCGTDDYVTPRTHLGNFIRVAPSTGMSGSVESRLSAEELPTPIKYVKNSDGSLMPVFSRDAIQVALEKKGICESPVVREARLAAEEADPTMSPRTKQQLAEDARQAERKAQRKRADVISAERIVTYRKLRARAANGLSLHMLRELAKLLVVDWNEYSLPDDILGDLYTFERSDETVCAYIDQAEATEVQLIIMDLLLGEALSISPHCLDDDPTVAEDSLEAIAKLEGVTADEDEVKTTAGQLAARRIDVEELENPSDVREAIEQNIEHLAEVCAHIANKAPHHIGNVEAAAQQLGYVYSVGGWKLKEDQPAPTTTGEAAADDAASTADDNTTTPAPAVREKLKLKVKPKADVPAEQATGTVVTVKKTRLVPPGEWPFPTTPNRQQF